MSKTMIDKMVDRFLAWPLPKDFAPDCGISFIENRSPHCWPVGANLLTADQARAMVKHMLADALPADTAAYAADITGDAAVALRALCAVVVACRSSVKFDLLHYEKMARAYRNIGREGEQIAVSSEAETQRLHELLKKIDALALTTPNVEGNAPGAAHGSPNE